MERRKVTPADQIIEVVCRFYGVSKTGLLGDDRTQHVAMVRHVAMYMARLHSALSYPELGNVFRRDHSSVIHGSNDRTPDEGAARLCQIPGAAGKRHPKR